MVKFATALYENLLVEVNRISSESEHIYFHQKVS